MSSRYPPGPGDYSSEGPLPSGGDSGSGRGDGLTGGIANNPMFTFVPWIVFWVVAGPRTWEVGSGCALLASIVLLVVGVGVEPLVQRTVARTAGVGAGGRVPVRFTAPKVLDIGTTLFFLVLVIIGLFADRQTLIGLEKYSQAISSAALGVIVIASILVGHPFTEQYARAGVPEEVWHTPVFRRTMTFMSAVWAAIFVVMAVLGLIAETGVTGSGTRDTLNWYIPIALIVLGLKFNEWYPKQVERQLGG